MPILLSQEIDRRGEFAELCNRRGLLRHAVEVGTEKAAFATQFLRNWEGDQLLCIDPWRNELPGYDEMHWDRAPDFHIAMAALARYNWRVRVFRGTSQAALEADLIKWPIDFCYIDANHQYKHVRQDIEGFWPHVAANGILAGHDYDQSKPGVVRAVNEFAERLGINAYLTHEPRFTSWYLHKTEAIWAEHERTRHAALDIDACAKEPEENPAAHGELHQTATPGDKAGRRAAD